MDVAAVGHLVGVVVEVVYQYWQALAWLFARASYFVRAMMDGFLCLIGDMQYAVAVLDAHFAEHQQNDVQAGV